MPDERTHPGDGALLRKALRGDGEAFGVLYDRYVNAVYRYVYFRTGERADSEDLTEMVFLKAWEQARASRLQVLNFRAWIFKVAHNLVIDYYRTRKQSFSLEDVAPMVDPQPGPEAVIQGLQEVSRLRQAIARLDSVQQHLLACRFVAGLSHAETARSLGLKENHLRVLQHRALRKLKQSLGVEVDQDE